MNINNDKGKKWNFDYTLNHVKKIYFSLPQLLDRWINYIHLIYNYN